MASAAAAKKCLRLSQRWRFPAHDSSVSLVDKRCRLKRVVRRFLSHFSAAKRRNSS